MAASQVSISNLALSRVGHTLPIAAVTENSPEAVACLAVYEQCRDEALEAMDWPFARRRQRPTALDETTLDLGEVPNDWTYAYSLPADCIPNGLRSVDGGRNLRPEEETPFIIEYDGTLEQNVVLTDTNAPEFIYTVALANPALFPPSFASAIAWRMAIELATALKKDASWLKLAVAGYDKALNEAAANALRGQKADQPPTPFQIAAR